MERKDRKQNFQINEKVILDKREVEIIVLKRYTAIVKDSEGLCFPVQKSELVKKDILNFAKDFYDKYGEMMSKLSKE
jgi:hypothetical protein